MYQELPGQTFCKSCEINTELVSDSANVTVTTCRCKRGARREPRPRPHIHFIPKCRVEPPAIVASFLGDQLRDAGYYDSSMAASMDAVTSRVCARQSGCAPPVSCAFPSCASVRYLVMCVLLACAIPRLCHCARGGLCMWSCRCGACLCASSWARLCVRVLVLMRVCLSILASVLVRS